MKSWLIGSILCSWYRFKIFKASIASAVVTARTTASASTFWLVELNWATIKSVISLVESITLSSSGLIKSLISKSWIPTANTAAWISSTKSFDSARELAWIEMLKLFA
jgi:hypothetical protein